MRLSGERKVYTPADASTRVGKMCAAGQQKGLMKKYAIYAMTALVATIALALAASDKGPRIVQLTEVDKSGVSARALVESAGGKRTQIQIILESKDKAADYAARLNFGVCEDIGGVAFKLNPVKDGKSKTEIALDYSTIDRPYAITLSKGADATAVAACGTFNQQ